MNSSFALAVLIYKHWHADGWRKRKTSREQIEIHCATAQSKWFTSFVPLWNKISSKVSWYQICSVSRLKYLQTERWSRSNLQPYLACVLKAVRRSVIRAFRWTVQPSQFASSWLHDIHSASFFSFIYRRWRGRFQMLTMLLLAWLSLHFESIHVSHTHTHAGSLLPLIKRRYSDRPSGRGEIMKCDFTLQLWLIFLTAWLGLTGEYSREDTLPQQKLHPLISVRGTKKDKEQGIGRETMSWSTQTAQTPNGTTHQWTQENDAKIM